MPTHLTPDGCALHYRIVGEGPLIALTPGGREGGDALAALTAELTKGARVLTWDRRNAGRSDLYFGDDIRSEQEIWADDLAELLRAIGVAPAWLAGGSAGARVSLLTALRHSDVAKGLVLWSASGGAYGCQFLGFQYHVPYILAAQRGGMHAVAETPFFAERIAANPANLDRLLALDPDAFVATLKRWNEFFHFRPDTPVVGATQDELAALSLPTLIFEGNDDIHPPQVASAIAGLIPGARLAPSPWTREAWMDRFTGRTTGSVFDLYPLLAPQILAFVGGG
jgi:pimeloyl-ACP methyl ester carboxylesterase